MSNKKYTKNFKLDTVKLAICGDKSIAQTAKDLGVNPTTLYAWTSQYRGEVLSEDLSLSPEQELKQLRKENARLLQERDILKKAAAYFAKHQA